MKTKECPNTLEIWKPIVNYEDKYEISNFGNIKSLDRLVNGRIINTFRKVKGKILKPYITSRGYLHIDLSEKTFQVHKLVALHFLEDKNSLKIINHIDGNKLNNNFNNLEFVSQLENVCHYFKNKKTSSNLTGVCFNKNSNKWKSRIRYNKKSIHLGYFDTEQEAYQARIDFEKEHNIINKYL